MEKVIFNQISRSALFKPKRQGRTQRGWLGVSSNRKEKKTRVQGMAGGGRETTRIALVLSEIYSYVFVKVSLQPGE